LPGIIGDRFFNVVSFIGETVKEMDFVQTFFTLYQGEIERRIKMTFDM
jgi:hypothetical protein